MLPPGLVTINIVIMEETRLAQGLARTNLIGLPFTTVLHECHWNGAIAVPNKFSEISGVGQRLTGLLCEGCRNYG